MRRLLPALLLIPACSKTPPPAPSAPSVAPVPSAAPAPTPRVNPNGLTGVLSEDEFKKLHDLKPDQPAALKGKSVDLPSSKAYLSLPPNAKPPMPAVVVIHEWWGLNDHIKLWTDRLAADGYAALAVDLYGGVVAKTQDDAMAAMKKVDAEAAKKVLLEAHGWLKKEPSVLASKRGVMGWCFGGKWSLELALAAPDVDATVVYYGHVTTDEKRLAALKSPLVGVFANQDKGIPPSMVDEFEAGLKKASASFRVLRYDGEHAFANPSNPRYDQKAAEAAWVEVRKFLKEKLNP